MSNSGTGKPNPKKRLLSLTDTQWLIIGAILILVGGVLLLKQTALPTATHEVSQLVGQTMSPEMQLDRLLGTDQSIMVFFHSMTCDQCIQMVEIVNAVYPEFANTIALIDVDVYDSGNQGLIDRSGIQMIPTLIFIDRNGEVDGYIGVMEKQVLRDRLQVLAAE